jgi:hypothetical protein
MDRREVRPSFSVPLSGEANELMELLRERIGKTDHVDCTSSKGRCAEFFVPEGERRLWSPYLSVQVDATGETTVLRGRFGPHPEVWTLYVFLSAAMGFMAVIGMILGFVQWQSGMEPWGLWGLYLGAPGLLCLYVVSAIGQRLSAHQMSDLRARLDSLLEGLRE